MVNAERTWRRTKRLPSALSGWRLAGGKRRQRTIPAVETLEDRNLLSFVAPVAYDAGPGPQAVAVANLNGDQAPDLVVVNGNNGGAGSVSVLLGNGDGSFQPAHSFAVGSSPSAVAVGDFNGDGIPDLAVTNAAGNNVSVLLGNGDGSFHLLGNFAAGSNPVSIVAGDFNGDGILDLVVASTGTSSNGSVSLLVGNGDGSFQAPRTLLSGTSFQAVAAGDFNGDGTLDIAATNAAGVNVLLGNGDGSFQSVHTYAAGTGPGAIVVADFNGDGVPDLAVANSSMFTSTSVSVLLGNGDGTFQIPLTSFVGISGSGSLSLAAGDFNGDGLADLAVVPRPGSIPFGPDQLVILQGRGDGFFQTPASYPAGGTAQAVAVADVNGDGALDLVVAASSNNFLPGGTGVVSVVLGNGDGSFRFAASNPDLNGPKAVGDFNGDGIPDLAIANMANSVGVLLGRGDGTFRTAGNFPTGTRPNAVVVGDFNGDGIPDLALTDSGSNDVSVLLGRGNGIFESPLFAAVGNSPTALAVGDFNGDGIPDLAVVVSNGVDVLLGNGDGTFQAPILLADANFPQAVVVADFNGDGIPDLAVANSSTNFMSPGVSVFLGNGDGTFQAPRSVNVGAAASLAVADLNGDGHADLVVGLTSPGFGATGFDVLLGNGDGNFQPAITVNTSHGLSGLAIADVNSDSIPDLVTTDSGTDQVRVWLGNGDGTFQTPPFGYLGAGGGLVVADVNGDGFPDIMVGSSILFNAADWSAPARGARAARPVGHARGAGEAAMTRERGALARAEALTLDRLVPARTGAEEGATVAPPLARTAVDRFFAAGAASARTERTDGHAFASLAAALRTTEQRAHALDLAADEAFLPSGWEAV